MTGRTTYLDLLQRRRKKQFIDRRKEIEIFRRNFVNEEPEFFIFNIYGQAGIGKTWLLERYQNIARESGACTAMTNEAEITDVREQSVISAMSRLAQEFARVCTPLKAYEERYSKYQQCVQEIESDPSAPRGLFDIMGRNVRLSAGAVKVTQPNLSAGGFVQDITADEEELVGLTSAWITYLARKLKSKDDLALFREPVDILTPLFAQGLNQLAEKQPIVLCFDTWERTGFHLGSWLMRLVEREELSTRVWLVIAGRNPLDIEWGFFLPIMASLELSNFTEEETRAYLKLQGVTDETRVQQILDFTEGLPVLVSTLSSVTGGSSSEMVAGLVDRLLKWIDDPIYRQAVLHCAIARRLNKDIVAAIIRRDDADDVFDWIRDVSFVQERPGYWEYHPGVRRMMLRFIRNRSPRDSRGVHSRLRIYYRGLLAEKGEGYHYQDPLWRCYTLEALYHGLMKESPEVEREGLENFLMALRYYSDFANEIVLTWLQAAEELEAINEVTKWAGLLASGWAAVEGNSWKEALPLCNALDERKEDLSDVARSQVHFVRGNAYARLKEYTQAIADFERAIDLTPEFAAAYNNRGNTYTALRSYEEAIGDFIHAIELEPDLASTHNNLGNTYLELGEFNRAIEQFNQAVQLVPDFALAYSNRGLVYARLRKYEEAFSDLNRATELAPDYAPAHYNTACAYALMGNAKQASKWLERAIDLDDKYYHMALVDPDLESIRDSESYKSLMKDE